MEFVNIPKCGTYNKYRGCVVKINTMIQYLKNLVKKRKIVNRSICKLITDTTVQVFSARVRDKGSDYCRFVQCSLINATISNVIDVKDTLISRSTALCFVVKIVKEVLTLMFLNVM